MAIGYVNLALFFLFKQPYAALYCVGIVALHLRPWAWSCLARRKTMRNAPMNHGGGHADWREMGPCKVCTGVVHEDVVVYSTLYFMIRTPNRANGFSEVEYCA